MRLLKRQENSCTVSQTTKLLAALLVSALISLPLFISLPGYECVHADGVAECMTELYTGQTLHSRNAGVRLPMASTTKIMTALIIIEDCNADEVITVPDEAVGVEGSSIYLKHGERISIKDLLYGLMLRSGNDSAVALAIHHSGDEQKFAQIMNERAVKMGATNTHFTNPSGLPDDSHYTTAHDLCIIACRAMKNQTFRKIVSSKSYSGEYRSYVNKNKILSRVEGANGIKTGYTLKAGRCLVSSAEREGMDVVCVVLNCPDMYERSQKLIERAFSEYEIKSISPKNVFMCNSLPCRVEEENFFLMPKGGELITKTYPCDSAQCNEDQRKMGRLEIYCKKNLIFSADLYSIVNR